MPENFEEVWLTLSEAANLFSAAANSPRAFGELLRTGRGRMLGKRRDHLDHEAIEHLLRRADEAPAFEISIRPDDNEIRLSLSRLAHNRLGEGDPRAQVLIEAQLADVLGAEWREHTRSGLTFRDVLVSEASLLAAMAAYGYMLPEPVVAKDPVGPSGYLSAWVPFAEALDHVQNTSNCSRRDTAEALVMALRDGRVASRNSDTGEEIDARGWFRVVFVGAEPLLGAGHSEIRRVELRREDAEKLWPDPAVALGGALPVDAASAGHADAEKSWQGPLCGRKSGSPESVQLQVTTGNVVERLAKWIFAKRPLRQHDKLLDAALNDADLPSSVGKFTKAQFLAATSSFTKPRRTRHR